MIIVPFLNYPAFRAGTRTSPIDRGNLNRSFPGKPDGTVTEKIADYIQRHLLPRADFVLDIHSVARRSISCPSHAFTCSTTRPRKRCQAAMEAFGAPYSMHMLELDSVGMFRHRAEEAGKVFVSTELGGGGCRPPGASPSRARRARLPSSTAKSARARCRRASRSSSICPMAIATSPRCMTACSRDVRRSR